MPLTISIDAMGGDQAPQMVIAGLASAHRQLAHRQFQVRYLVFGDEAAVKPLLAKHRELADVVELRHTDVVIQNDEGVRSALRAKNSSMRLAIEAVKNGEAAGVVSAGNTGALMGMAKVVLKTLPGIHRPALAQALPTEKGACVMLDLGANVECDAENLVEFAVMGEVFARQVLKIQEPSVGLLNVGVEELKGVEEVKKAAQILQNSHLPIRFHGFIEGDDIGAGTVDVVVVDGFTGNVALKTAEGTAKMLTNFLRQSFSKSLWAKLGYVLMRVGLQEFREKFDPRRYNGAMLVGLNGICVKSHGGTDAVGFANAVCVAVNLVRHDFNARIREDLHELIAGDDEATPQSEGEGGTDSSAKPAGAASEPAMPS